MTDSLQAAAALVDKLGGDFEAVLPEADTVIDCDALAADRLELRQVAGISAGGSLELLPGNYDFGPVRHGPGRLDSGDPDTVCFTLRLDENLSATIGPGETPVSLDDQPIVGPTDLAGRVINAGSARFVVARPRPPRKRSGAAIDLDIDRFDPWVVQPVPGPIAPGADASSLIGHRRRLHWGPDELRHRIIGGRSLLWDRGPGHPLFGTAVVAMADVPVREYGLEISAPVPVSVNLLESATMTAGDRHLQLAVVRHAVISLAASIHPDDLHIEVLSDNPDVDFIRQLPHARHAADEERVSNGRDPQVRGLDVRALEARSFDVRGPRRRLLVVDNPGRHGEWTDGHWSNGRWQPGRLTLPGVDGENTTILAITAEDDVLWPDADVLAVEDEATISVLGGGGHAPIEGATPIGFARSMTAELVGSLRAVGEMVRSPRRKR